MKIIRSRINTFVLQKESIQGFKRVIFFLYISPQNIVACGAGFVAGLGFGDNTISAVIRIGLIEMMRFAEVTDYLL